MVRLERESSNSFGTDLFDVLEDWDRVLQAENVDLEELSRIEESAVISQDYSAETGRKPHVKR